MTSKTLLVTVILTVVFMSLAFLVARSRKRLDVVDAAWGLGFIVIAWSVELHQPSKRSLLLAILVSIWGTRLALHIIQRLRFRGEDERYKELASKWRGNYWLRAYFSIFLLQGALALIISLPILLAANPELSGGQWAVGKGAVIWLIGFVFEAIADKQLQDFLRQKNRPKVMRTGLWKYSRHPNYFGELTQWWGVGIIALSSTYGWIGLIGPAVLTFLIVFISGLPPIERKRAKDADYQAYKRHTSALVPLPPRA